MNEKVFNSFKNCVIYQMLRSQIQLRRHLNAFHLLFILKLKTKNKPFFRFPICALNRKWSKRKTNVQFRFWLFRLFFFLHGLTFKLLAWLMRKNGKIRWLTAFRKIKPMQRFQQLYNHWMWEGGQRCQWEDSVWRAASEKKACDGRTIWSCSRVSHRKGQNDP